MAVHRIPEYLLVMKKIRTTVYECDTCGKRFFSPRSVHIHAHHIHGEATAADHETKAQMRDRLLDRKAPVRRAVLG